MKVPAKGKAVKVLQGVLALFFFVMGIVCIKIAHKIDPDDFVGI